MSLESISSVTVKVSGCLVRLVADVEPPWQRLQKHRPEIVHCVSALSPTGGFQDDHPDRLSELQLRRDYQRAIKQSNVGVDLFELPFENNNLFLFEAPNSGETWSIPPVLQFMSQHLHEAIRAKGHGCACGLRLEKGSSKKT